MDKIKEYDLRWQALRYAVDQIDLAWSYESLEYEGELREQKRFEMMIHRDTLCRLQDTMLSTKRALEESLKERS